MRNGKILTTPTPGGGTSMNVTFVEYPIVQHTFTPETLTEYNAITGKEEKRGLPKKHQNFPRLSNLLKISCQLSTFPKNFWQLPTFLEFAYQLPTWSK